MTRCRLLIGGVQTFPSPAKFGVSGHVTDNGSKFSDAWSLVVISDCGFKRCFCCVENRQLWVEKHSPIRTCSIFQQSRCVAAVRVCHSLGFEPEKNQCQISISPSFTRPNTASMQSLGSSRWVRHTPQRTGLHHAIIPTGGPAACTLCSPL